jgi:hypothetical protein
MIRVTTDGERRGKELNKVLKAESGLGSTTAINRQGNHTIMPIASSLV